MDCTLLSMNSNYITHPNVPRCRYCKMYGHIIQNCRRIRPCEICDVKGHRTEFCRVRCVHCEGFQHRSDMCPTIYDAEDSDDVEDDEPSSNKYSEAKYNHDNKLIIEIK